jgi:hypothetical protein
LKESLGREISKEIPLEDDAAVIDDFRLARLDDRHQSAQSAHINLTERDARKQQRILRQVSQRRSNHVVSTNQTNTFMYMHFRVKISFGPNLEQLPKLTTELLFSSPVSFKWGGSSTEPSSLNECSFSDDFPSSMSHGIGQLQLN